MTTGLRVRVYSFSYRSGIPADPVHGGGFIFDCRCLPNPGREEYYRDKTGRNDEVREYLKAKEETSRFLRSSLALVEQSVENYLSRNFESLVVGFGCTGGQHRSVYCAERCVELLERYDVAVELRHIQLERYKEEGLNLLGGV